MPHGSKIAWSSVVGVLVGLFVLLFGVGTEFDVLIAAGAVIMLSGVGVLAWFVSRLE